MAKRIADKELTDRNWDQEDEGEEAGTFSVASEDVLKNRAIKKAKRRNVGSEGESGGAFKGFKGFSLTTGGGSIPAGFSGFGNGGGFKGLGGLTDENSIKPSFGGFSSPVTSSAAPVSLMPVVVASRCKLFYKKDSEFKDKGVGTLHWFKEETDTLVPQNIIKSEFLVRGADIFHPSLMLGKTTGQTGNSNVSVSELTNWNQ